MAERRDVDEVRIVGMNLDIADVAGVLQPDVFPGPATVGALVTPSPWLTLPRMAVSPVPA
ncbi:MAG: hypothetical protein R2849_20375 [Thermomicrobiales bacterium]